jgi:hypothetical protein
MADHVVIMTEGEIEAQGKPSTLEEKGYKFENAFGTTSTTLKVGRRAQRIGKFGTASHTHELVS